MFVAEPKIVRIGARRPCQAPFDALDRDKTSPGIVIKDALDHDRSWLPVTVLRAPLPCPALPPTVQAVWLAVDNSATSANEGFSASPKIVKMPNGGDADGRDNPGNRTAGCCP